MQNGKILTNNDLVNITLKSIVNSSAVPTIKIENTKADTDLWLSGVTMKNTGGLVDITSKGSIWAVNGTAITAKDISIATAGSFYQSYGDGRLDTGGNPLLGDVGAAIYDWINTNSLFTKVDPDTLEAMKNTAASEINGLLAGYTDKNALDSAVKTALDETDKAQNIYDAITKLYDALTKQATAQGTWNTADGVLSGLKTTTSTALEELKGLASAASLADYNNPNHAGYQKVETLLAGTNATAFNAKKGEYTTALTNATNYENGYFATVTSALKDANAVVVTEQTNYKTTASETNAPTTVADAQTEQGKRDIAVTEKNENYYKLRDIQAQVERKQEYLGMLNSGGQSVAVSAALKDYNEAIMVLQSVCTTESWEIVFGDGVSQGNRVYDSLVLKRDPNEKATESLEFKAVFDETQDAQGLEVGLKFVYERAVKSAAETYVAEYGIANATQTAAAGTSAAAGYASLASSVPGFLADLQKFLDEAVKSSSGNDEPSIIYGARSVYISAETLNINGTIKSGKTNFEPINLNSDEVRKAIGDGTQDRIITDAVFAKPNADPSNTLDNPKKPEDFVTLPTIRYIAATGAIEIDNIVAYGGDITLYGNIISTGNGKIEVADGFGNISIDAGSYDLVLGKVDMGGKDGLEGIIRLIDLGSMGIDRVDGKKDAAGNDIKVPLTTIFTRNNDGVQIEQRYGNYVFANTAKEIGGLNEYADATTAGRNLNNEENWSGVGVQAIYQPTKNRWLQTSIDTEATLAWTYMHKEGTYYGSGTKTSQIYINEFGNVQPATAQVGAYKSVGTFLVDKSEDASFVANSDKTLLGQFVRVAKPSSNPVEIDKEWIDDTNEAGKSKFKKFFIDRKGEAYWLTTYSRTQVVTETFDTYLNAFRPIDIIFTGNQDPSSAGITISGSNSITLTDLIRTSQEAKITTTGGDIIGTDNAVINAQNVTLEANNIYGVGTEYNALKLETMPGQGIGLDAKASGTVNIYAEKGSLLVDKVNGNDVTLRSDGDILQRGTGITAYNLDLTAGGRIGHVSGPLNPSVVNPEYLKQNTGQMFNFTVANNTSLAAVGQIDAHFTGDLHAKSIVSTASDVNLSVTGNILDANPNAVPDPLSDAYKKDLWGELKVAAADAKEHKWNILTDEEKQDLWQDLSYGKREELWKDKSDDEVAQLWANLSDGAKWDIWGNDTGWDFTPSEGTFAGSIFFADAGTRMNTTSMIKEPNIAGRNITLNVGGAIGNDHDADGGIRIVKDENLIFKLTDAEMALLSLTKDQADNLTLTNLPESILVQLEALPSKKYDNKREEYEDIMTKRRAIADAEWSDVKFYDKNDKEIDSSDTENIAYMKIFRYDNITIEATGTLTTQSGGWTNIGSQGNIVIDNNAPDSGIVSKGTNENGDSLRLKTDGSIFATNYGNIAIHTKNAVLEAAGGYLGMDKDNLLKVSLTGDNSWIVGRGADGVYLSFASIVDGKEVANNANLREIGSWGDIYLKAASFAVDIDGRDIARVGGLDIVMVATGGSIGSKVNPLGINQQYGGSVKLDAFGGIYAYSKASLNIEELLAGGNVEITADLDLTVSGEFTVKVGDALLQSVHSNLLLTEVLLAVTGNATFLSASDVIMSGGNMKIGREWDVIANNNIFMTSIADVNAGDTKLIAKNGDVSIVDGTLNLESLLVSGTDISFINLILTIAGEFKANAKNSLLLKESSISAGTMSLTSEDDLTLCGGTSKFDSLSVSGNNVSFVDLIQLTIVDKFDVLAGNDLLLTNSNIKSGATNLIAVNDLTIDGGEAFLGDTLLSSGNDLTVKYWTLVGDGKLDVRAVNDILLNGSSTLSVAGNMTKVAGNNVTIEGVSLYAGGNMSKDAGKDISVAGSILGAGGNMSKSAENNIIVDGSSTLIADGNMSKDAGKNIYITGSTLDAGGNMSKGAGNNISVTGSDIFASGNMNKDAGNDITVAGSSLVALGDMSKEAGSNVSVGTSNLAAENMSKIAGNDIVVVNSSLTAGSTMSKTAGNDISIMGSKINVGDLYGITAANRLTIHNTVATIGDFAGNYGLADFDASGYRLLDWHFYTKTVLLSGIDIYNDPIYWNSLAYDRITGRTMTNLWLANATGGQDDDDLDELIKGLWLSSEEEEEGEELLDTLNDPGIGMPVAELSIVRGW